MNKWLERFFLPSKEDLLAQIRDLQQRVCQKEAELHLLKKELQTLRDDLAFIGVSKLCRKQAD